MHTLATRKCADLKRWQTQMGWLGPRPLQSQNAKINTWPVSPVLSVDQAYTPSFFGLHLVDCERRRGQMKGFSLTRNIEIVIGYRQSGSAASAASRGFWPQRGHPISATVSSLASKRATSEASAPGGRISSGTPSACRRQVWQSQKLDPNVHESIPYRPSAALKGS